MSEPNNFLNRYMLKDVLCQIPGLLIQEAVATKSDTRILLLRYLTGEPNPLLPPKSHLQNAILKELKQVQAISYDTLSPIMNFGFAENTFFVEYSQFEGQTLRVAEGERSRVKLADVMWIAEQLINVIEHLHANGVVHGLLHPSIVFFNSHQEVRLLGTGFKQLIPCMLNASSAFQGLQYLSPETIKTGECTPDSDWYAMGVILYEMLTGVCPFPGDDLSTLLGRMSSGEFISINTLFPSLPTEFDTLLAKALHSEPRNRYHSGKELLADLKQIPIPCATNSLRHEIPEAQRNVYNLEFEQFDWEDTDAGDTSKDDEKTPTPVTVESVEKLKVVESAPEPVPDFNPSFNHNDAEEAEIPEKSIEKITQKKDLRLYGSLFITVLMVLLCLLFLVVVIRLFWTSGDSPD